MHRITWGHTLPGKCCSAEVDETVGGQQQAARTEGGMLNQGNRVKARERVEEGCDS